MKKPRSAAPSAATSVHPLDHDGDGRKGGMAPAPALQHLVVQREDDARGLVHGEVVAVPAADVKALLAARLARPASPAEVELAQPRIRILAARSDANGVRGHPEPLADASDADGPTAAETEPSPAPAAEASLEPADPTTPEEA